MRMKIAVLPGDGIGKEVTAEAVKVLRAALGSEALELTEAPVGGAGVEAAGDPLPPRTLEIAQRADAILFGSAGVPGDEAIPYAMRPGASLLRLRKALGLFANFRPAFLFPEMGSPEYVREGWYPQLIDYLHMSFATATAFSPTDVSAIKHWSKLMMTFECAVSLLLAVLVVARAINILPS